MKRKISKLSFVLLTLSSGVFLSPTSAFALNNVGHLVDPTVQIINNSSHDLTICIKNLTLTKLIKIGVLDNKGTNTMHCALVKANSTNNALQYDWVANTNKGSNKSIKNTVHITAKSKDNSFNLTQMIQFYSYAGQNSSKDTTAAIHITINNPGFVNVSINPPQKENPFNKK